MFARLLKDTFQLYALVRALAGEPEQHPDEPAVLAESIPVRIGGMKSGRNRGGVGGSIRRRWKHEGNETLLEDR